jgi:hypothetical protein
LKVSGVSQPQPRFHVDSRSRRALNVIVFINLEGGVFIKELTGTSYKGMRKLKKYSLFKNKKEQQAKRLTGSEYVDCVRAAWRHFNRQKGFQRVSAQAKLVQDGAKVHTSIVTQKGLQQLGLPTLLISPRSPDLDPLDYSVFGAAKTRLASDLPLSATWEQRVARFKEILQAAPVDKAIRQMSLRASACIAAGGRHFEHTLKKRKRDQLG